MYVPALELTTQQLSVNIPQCAAIIEGRHGGSKAPVFNPELRLLTYRFPPGSLVSSYIQKSALAMPNSITRYECVCMVHTRA